MVDLTLCDLASTYISHTHSAPALMAFFLFLKHIPFLF